MYPKAHLLTVMLLATALFGGNHTSTASQANTETMSGSAKPPGESASPAAPETLIEIEGTVSYQDLEGGFFAIQGQDGKRYEPVNLPPPYREDGLKVWLQARPRPDMMSVRMYGVIIDVIEIEAR